MRVFLVLLACLAAPQAEGAKPRKPRPIKDIRELELREFEIDIVRPVPLPSRGRTTEVDTHELDVRAAEYVCGSKEWTQLGEPERRIDTSGGRLTFEWTLRVRCGGQTTSGAR